MNLLIIGAGNPVPSFIRRRLQKLIAAGVRLTIVAEAGQRMDDFPGAAVIRIGGTLTFMQRFNAIVRACMLPHRLLRLMACRPELTWGRRLTWAVKFFSLSQLPPPDVVHIQWLASVPEFDWLRRYFRCPVVGSVRGSQLTVYPITRPGYDALIKKAIEQVDYIHCVSEDMALACRRLGAPLHKLVVNYNGIDLKQFVPGSGANASGRITIVSVGSLLWRKGVYYQLLILKALLLRSDNVQLVLVGDGPDREGLQYTASTLGLTEHITFAGSVKAADLPFFLQEADVYLSTSIAEGLANSVVEAVASGLPVVAFACEGMEEVLTEGYNGFILPFGDIHGVADKLAFLVDHGEQRKKMGTQARALAVDKFDDNEWVARMIKTYQDIAKK